MHQALDSISNRNRLKFLAKDTAVYGGAKALSLAVGFITLPVVARHFSVADYGLIDLLSTLGAFLGTVIVFGQDSAVGRYFYEYTETCQRRELISQSLWVQLGVCLFTLVVVGLSWPLWVSRLTIGDSQELDLLLLLVFLQVPFNVLLSFSQNLLKWSFARSAFLFVSLGSTFATAAVVVFGILFFDFGIIAIFSSYLGTRLLFGIIGVYLCRKWLLWPRNYLYAREMLPFALPFGIVCVIASFTPLLERGLVNTLLSAEDLGLFAMGVKIASLISLPIAAFQTAWGPFSLAIHKESNAAVTYGAVLKVMTIVLSIMLLGLVFFAEASIRLFASDKYVRAAIVVFPVSLGLMIQGLGWITEIGIGVAKKSYMHLPVYFVYLIVVTGSIYILAKSFGLEGVAWGMMVGICFKAVMASFLAQRVHPLEWPFISIAVFIVLLTMFGAMSSVISVGATLLENIIYFIIAIVLVVLGSWYLLLNSNERSSVKRAVHTKLV